MAITYLVEKLKGEYKEAYERANIYSLTTNMEDSFADELRMNLLDSLLNAQENKEPVETVIGSDMETFCKSYFQVYDRKEKLISFGRTIYRISWFVFVFELIGVLLEVWDNGPVLQMKSDISGYIWGGMVAGIISLIDILWVRPWIFKRKKINTVAYSCSILSLDILLIFLGCVLFDEFEVKILSVLIVAITGAYIFLYIVIRAYLRYGKTGNVRKERNLVKEAEKEAKYNMYAKKFAKDAVMQYERTNRRRLHKGKEPLKIEEFMEKKRKIWVDIRKWQLLVTVIVCIPIIIPTVLGSTLTDALIFIFLITLVIIASIFVSSKFDLSYVMVRMLDECKERGVTILDYDKE